MDNKFLKNLVVAFVSQGIAIIMGLFTSFVIPKFVDVQNFASWQLFMLFNTYIALFHFGVNDGVYLTTAGKTYSQIDKESIGSQFKLISVIQVAITLGYLLVSRFVPMDTNTRYIVFGALVYMIVKNMGGYLGFVFQSVNETHIYSKSLIIEKVVFMILLVGLLLTKVDSYKYFIWAFNFSSLISLLYVMFIGRDIVFSKTILNEKNAKSLFTNAKIGASLMFSAMASNFILGNVKFSINKYWGLETFGRVSLAFAASSFVLIFIQQFSMVLFPSLKLQEAGKQKSFYYTISEYMKTVLPVFLLFYYPLRILLGMWLPDYEFALAYLGYLLPVVIVDAVTQMIYITYMKILREEKTLLKVNVFFMLLCLGMSVLNGILFKNLNLLFTTFLLVMILRAVYLDAYISYKHYKIRKQRSNILFYTVIALFVISSVYFVNTLGLIIYLVVLAIYLILKKDKVNKLINLVKNIYFRRTNGIKNK